MKFTILFLLVLLGFSCSQKETKAAQETISTSKTVKPKKTVAFEQVGDTIHLLHENENGVFAAEGAIDSLHSRIYVKFENGTASHLVAAVKPSSGVGNIRFNQILYPDNSADGPFGQDLELELTQKGEHTLIIGRSLMAGNPYVGKFNLTLQIKK